AERTVAEACTRSGAQRKTGDGAAGVLDEFDLISKQCRGKACFRLWRERLYIPRRANTQDQQVTIDGDNGFASGRELVSPGILGERLPSKPESVPAHQVRACCSYSQIVSRSSVSATSVLSALNVIGLVNVFGSSRVISKSMCPKSRRWK